MAVEHVARWRLSESLQWGIQSKNHCRFVHVLERGIGVAELKFVDFMGLSCFAFKLNLGTDTK